MVKEPTSLPREDSAIQDRRHRFLEIVAIAFLVAGMLWIIVSTLPKSNSLSDSMGMLLAASALGVVILTVATILHKTFVLGKKRRYVKKYAYAVGGVGLIFGLSLWLVNMYSSNQGSVFGSGSDAGGILLGAASLALFVFSTLIAMAGLIGWPRLKKYIKERVEKALEPVRIELRGRSFSNAGYALGEISLGRDTFSSVRLEVE